MRDVFVTDEFELDLSEVKISYHQENPRMKDSYSVSYSFPFTFYLDGKLRKVLGNYSSMHGIGLKKRYHGKHQMEGWVHKGVLEILSVEGDKVEAQIETGEEAFAVFDKKLRDLPLKRVEVDNIYQHAWEVECTRSVLGLDYRFPRIGLKKEGAGWEQYRGFLNHRINEMTDNNEGAGYDRMITRNIIHPFVSLRYLIEQGFAAAGYDHVNGLYSNSYISKVYVYSGIDYYVSTQQQEKVMRAQITNFVQEQEIYGDKYGKYFMQESLETAGHWRVVCNTTYISPREKPLTYKLKQDGVVLIEGVVNHWQDVSFTQEIEVRDRSEIRFEVEGIWDPHWELYINIIGERDSNGNLIEKVINPNVVDLKRAVPDMTFGELLKVIKNWFNCDFRIRNGAVEFELFGIWTRNYMRDLSRYEVLHPQVKKGTKGAYVLTFPEMDDPKDKIPDTYISEESVRTDTTRRLGVNEVAINGYALSPRSYMGGEHLMPLKGDGTSLALVGYQENGYPGEPGRAVYLSDLMPPKLGNVLKDWYQMRIGSDEVSWSFIAKKNLFKDIDIRDWVYVYGRRGLIKSWTKESIDREYYKVSIEVVLLNGIRG
jgi:hypothetical protein|nr:MAG TPA: hypothetical protein [Caudoviricetes sp.]